MVDIFDLTFDVECYYIKRPMIVEKIVFDNRTFYAKFEKIQEPLTPLVVKQHLNKQYTIAVPLLKDNLTNYLVLDYKGEESFRFTPLVKHILKTLQIEKYAIYQGRDEKKLQVFIEVERLTLKEASKKINQISDLLKIKMSKQWKSLPSSLLPNDYNIVTLPYNIF